jgi:putative transposase
VKTALYDTDLTDAQWAYIQPLLPKPKKLGRPPLDRRVILNAVLYVLKGGIPWRLPPKCFPPWQTVYAVFRKWAREHVWAAVQDALRVCVRRADGRNDQPSAAKSSPTSQGRWAGGTDREHG